VEQSEPEPEGLPLRLTRREAPSQWPPHGKLEAIHSTQSSDCQCGFCRDYGTATTLHLTIASDSDSEAQPELPPHGQSLWPACGSGSGSEPQAPTRSLHGPQRQLHD
jgi:hypothetical protein